MKLEVRTGNFIIFTDNSYLYGYFL